MQLTLGQLAERLRKEHEGGDRLCENAFDHEHHQRFHGGIGFERVGTRRLITMLLIAERAIGDTFATYKGDEVVMEADCLCWLGKYDSMRAEPFTVEELERMLA